MQPDPTEHLGLVHYWATRFARTRQDHDDAYSMGVLGLLKACQRYDAARGTAFSTYASLLIRQSIIRHLKQEQPLIRVPHAWTVDQRIPVTSLNAPLPADDGSELGDLIPDDIENSPADGADDRTRVHAALTRLPRRDALVLKLRHGIRDEGEGYPMTLEEIACVLRITRERVRQIERRALVRLLRRLAV